MTLHLDTPRAVAAMRRPALRSCPHCGEWLVAPERSEFRDDGVICHRWSCEACGRDCETAVAVTTH